jgi:uncharacterized membrane protein
MNRIFAATALSTAVGLAVALQAASGRADDTQKQEKCYGINAAGKNDCATAAHSCAGQSTSARDPNSYVLVPSGACAKIDGGVVKSS